MRTLKAIIRSIWITASEWFQQTFGRSCPIHGTWYRSELCPQCVHQRFIDDDTFDRRPAWTKSEGRWPLKPRSGEVTSAE